MTGDSLSKRFESAVGEFEDQLKAYYTGYSKLWDEALERAWGNRTYNRELYDFPKLLDICLYANHNPEELLERGQGSAQSARYDISSPAKSVYGYNVGGRAVRRPRGGS